MDRFLFTHKHPDLPVFNLASDLSSIAIRDQMVRAMLLAESLPGWLENELGLSHTRHPVLVVGGGICGLTVAIALTQRGLRVEVAERQAELFSVQRDCNSRWIDPNQYDWPHNHWRCDTFPFDSKHRSVPFPWKAARASDLVQEWSRLFHRSMRTKAIGSRLTIRQSTEVALSPAYLPSRLLRAQFNDPQTKLAVETGEFSAVVLAIGQGDERTTLGNSPQFQSLGFWDSDTLEQEHCGLAGGQAQEGTVLISGSGDGALQDLLRVLTRLRSVREIYDRLELDRVGIDFAKIFSADGRAERGSNWLSEAAFAQFQAEQHQCYEEVVQSILATRGLRSRILKLLQNSPQRTVLVTRQDHFTCQYSLNRFLALLLIRAVGSPLVQWRSGWQVHQVQSITPPPLPTTALNCLGHPWRVTLQSTQGGTSSQQVEANVVLLRHGLDTTELSLSAGQSFQRLIRPFPPPYLF